MNREIRKEIKTELDAIYDAYSRTRDLDNGPTKTVNELINHFGNRESARMLGNLVVLGKDPRVSQRNLEWAKGIPGVLNKLEMNAAGIFYDDGKMHRAHLDQLATTFRILSEI